MIIKKLNIENNSEQIREIWNNEYNLIYPISKELLKRNISNANLDNSYVVEQDDKIIAFIITKDYQDEYTIKGYDDCAWISLVFVASEFRNQGIGTLLINKVESEYENKGKHTVNLGKDLNDFFPGLPIDLKKSLGWFEKRGYVNLYNTCDLVNNKNIGDIPLKNNSVEYIMGDKITKEEVISFLENNWPGRWTKEAIDYYNNGGTGREYLLGVKDGKICAFAKVCFPDTPNVLISNSLTWRDKFKHLGGIGPLGVNVENRHQNIGYDIVTKATNILFNNGASDIIIDWTNLLDFYRKIGYEVWKSYEYMTKELKGDK